MMRTKNMETTKDFCLDLMILEESVLVKQSFGISNVAVERTVVGIIVNGQNLQQIVWGVFQIANGFLITTLVIIKLLKPQVYF